MNTQTLCKIEFFDGLGDDIEVYTKAGEAIFSNNECHDMITLLMEDKDPISFNKEELKAVADKLCV